MNVNAIDTEKFIEIVKSHPPLYNTEHRLFKNVAKKNEIWEQVAKELNEPSEYLSFLIYTVYLSFTKTNNDKVSIMVLILSILYCLTYFYANVTH